MPFRGRRGLVDLSKTASQTFDREVRPGSEVPSQSGKLKRNDQSFFQSRRFVTKPLDFWLRRLSTRPPQALLGPVTDLLACFECGLWGWLADMDPRRGSRLCRSYQSSGDWRTDAFPTICWHAATLEGESRTARTQPWRSGDRIARERHLFGCSRDGCGFVYQPGWLWPLQIAKRVSEWATRGGESWNTAMSGLRIRGVRLERSLGSVRTRRRAQFPGACALGGSSGW